MQRQAHHQRLAARLLEHLVGVVDHHLREVLRVHQPGDDHRDVVQLLRIRHRPERLAAAGAQAHRLVVVAPVEAVAKARLGEQVGGVQALRDPGREPALRRGPAMGGDPVAAAFDQAPLVRLAQAALALGVGVAVADDLVAARHAGIDQLRGVVVERGVENDAGRQAELLEELETAPGADPVAVLAPAVVQHVGRRRHRAEARAQALAEREVLDVEAEIHGQAGAARPVEIGPADDRPVGEATVRRQRADVRPAHGRAGSSVARPARTSSHSALSFQTSMAAMRRSRTT